MSLFQSKAEPARQPYSPTQRSSGHPKHKLRDSCHACAAGKVKCPKEKPSCSRCEKRGIKCQYILSQRPGRKRENSTTIDAKASPKLINNCGNTRTFDTIQAEPSVAPQVTTITTTPPSTLATTNGQLALITTDHVSPAGSPDIFSAFSDTCISPELGDFNSEMNEIDLFLPSMDFSFGLPMLESGSITPSQNDVASLLMTTRTISLDHTSIPFSRIDPSSASGSSPQSSSDLAISIAKNNVACVSSSNSLGCLTRALDILKTLISDRALASPQASPTSPTMAISDTSNDDSARKVLTENKDSIDAVSNMLTCSCAEESFLLPILSMIVLKVLVRYAGAAQIQPRGAEGAQLAPDRSSKTHIASSSKDQTSHLGRSFDASHDNEGLGRIAAQRVLSELHRVQTLVNQLSPRLRWYKEMEASMLGSDQYVMGLPHVTARDEGVAMMSFSAGTLDQLETDLRKSLTVLSAELINRLRQA